LLLFSNISQIYRFIIPLWIS